MYVDVISEQQMDILSILEELDSRASLLQQLETAAGGVSDIASSQGDLGRFIELDRYVHLLPPPLFPPPPPPPCSGWRQ